MTTSLVSIPRPNQYWLFSPALDLAAFAGSACVALGLLLAGSALGVLHDETPDWTWVAAVLLVDVAHVYSTAFRIYFVPKELHRRPWLYLLTPVIAFLIGASLYANGENLFWRVLAYLAVFHFVRQQYGWVRLYRARCGETDSLGGWLDGAAIYLATVYPLIHWHAHLPRHFWWFREHDFVAVPHFLEQIAAPLYWSTLVLYFLRSLWRGLARRQFNPGKDIVVATTALCWYVGIVTFNSDYAFTVTNVIIHGVPYLVLVYWYSSYANGTNSSAASRRRPSPRLRTLLIFLASIWLMAYVEELVWDRTIWGERAWLFGSAWDLGGLRSIVVPLLAVPQITHYVLDGFIWRRRSNPGVQSAISLEGSP
jgi:hypothetical protein